MPLLLPLLLNLVGVGIEPTFRVFQTRANPSQLSDRRLLPIANCRLILVFGLWLLVFDSRTPQCVTKQRSLISWSWRRRASQRPKSKDLRPRAQGSKT